MPMKLVVHVNLGRRQYQRNSARTLRNHSEMKRRRCAICAKWNHKTEDYFVLTRCKNDDEMTTIVPMGTTVDHVTGGGRMEDNRQEGAV